MYFLYIGIVKHNDEYSFIRANRSYKTPNTEVPCHVICSLKISTREGKWERIRRLGVWQVKRRACLHYCSALTLPGWQIGTLGASLPSVHSTAPWLYLPSGGRQASTEQALTWRHPKRLVSRAHRCTWSTLSTAVNPGLSSFTALCWWVICFLQQLWRKKKHNTKPRTKKLLVFLRNIYV